MPFYAMNRAGEVHYNPDNLRQASKRKAHAKIIIQSRTEALEHAHEACEAHPWDGRMAIFTDGSGIWDGKTRRDNSKVTSISAAIAYRPSTTSFDWLSKGWTCPGHNGNNDGEVVGLTKGLTIGRDESFTDAEFQTLVEYSDAMTILSLLKRIRIAGCHPNEWMIVNKPPKINIAELWKLIDGIETIRLLEKKVEIRWLPSHGDCEPFGLFYADIAARTVNHGRIAKLQDLESLEEEEVIVLRRDPKSRMEMIALERRCNESSITDVQFKNEKNAVLASTQATIAEFDDYSLTVEYCGEADSSDEPKHTPLLQGEHTIRNCAVPSCQWEQNEQKRRRLAVECRGKREEEKTEKSRDIPVCNPLDRGTTSDEAAWLLAIWRS